MAALDHRRGDDVGSVQELLEAFPVQELIDRGILTRTSFNVAAIVKLTERSNEDDLTEVPEFLRWAAIGSWLGGISGAVKWWIGDWLAFGEGAWGERYAQAAEATGLDIGTLQNYAYVCRQIMPSRRREELSFTAHLKVAPLDPPKQKKWLERAAKEQMRSKELEVAIRESGDAPPRRAKSNGQPEPARADGIDRHENATVEIKATRWSVFVKVSQRDGTTIEYVASADRALADSSIYFATREEYDQDLKRGGF